MPHKVSQATPFAAVQAAPLVGRSAQPEHVLHVVEPRRPIGEPLRGARPRPWRRSWRLEALCVISTRSPTSRTTPCARRPRPPREWSRSRSCGGRARRFGPRGRRRRPRRDRGREFRRSPRPCAAPCPTARRPCVDDAPRRSRCRRLAHHPCCDLQQPEAEIHADAHVGGREHDADVARSFRDGGASVRAEPRRADHHALPCARQSARWARVALGW